jgi:CO/xanthine dehydrogenase FAD-binding subunit
MVMLFYGLSVQICGSVCTLSIRQIRADPWLSLYSFDPSNPWPMSLSAPICGTNLIMQELTWYYPESLDEIPDLLGKEGVIPHGGGTGILRTNLRRTQGLIDLSHLPLDFFRADNGIVEIGATQSFADVAENMRRIDPESVLTKSLSMAASTPLRNRITIGGSVVFFPMWSDLMGPLIALDAEVDLIGAHEGLYPIERYARDKGLRHGTLVKGVRFVKENWISYHFRATRTHFDYSSFNITLLLKVQDNGRVGDIRIVIVGTKEKCTRLRDVEDYLKGRDVSEIETAGIVERMDVEFYPKSLGSAEYMIHLAGVELERGLEAIFRCLHK